VGFEYDLSKATFMTPHKIFLLTAVCMVVVCC